MKLSLHPLIIAIVLACISIYRDIADIPVSDVQEIGRYLAIVMLACTSFIMEAIEQIGKRK